ncbi:MAG: hypothetical protein M3040_14850 [Bacteroidota bacterium]|nr:hypothetical protein [Bacteroidota bacterium]
MGTKKEIGSFPIVSTSAATAIYTGEKDYWLVRKSASLLQDDIELVTGKKPQIIHTIPSSIQNIIIIGSTNQSSFIQRLIQQKKLNTAAIEGKWEGYQTQLITHPTKGINSPGFFRMDEGKVI